MVATTMIKTQTYDKCSNTHLLYSLIATLNIFRFLNKQLLKILYILDYIQFYVYIHSCYNTSTIKQS